MYIQNSDTNKWEKKSERLDKKTYNFLRQELDKMRFYGRCSDGTTYLPINSLSDIYDKIKYKDNKSWYIGSSTSVYALPTTGDIEITTSTQDKYNKYLLEGGMTIKNLFTDEKVINDSIDNYIEVDLISTESIDNITSEKKGLYIDNIRVKENHKILIKDQQDFVTLSNSINPDNFFIGNHTVVNIDTTTTQYSFYNSENGIYTYINNRLVRTNDLDIYETNMRYSVVAKLGKVNFDKQYHLSRLKNGFYPLTSNNEPIEFIEKHNWVLRNKLEYQNVLEVNYNDVIKHGSHIFQSYTIPERTITVGDFGTIIINQNNISNVVKSKIKHDLNGISEINGYYWICGENGTLLKVSKVDLSITHINIDTFQTLNSISFFNDMRGVVVGDYNTIYYTFNGGVTWKNIDITGYEHQIYNKCLYYSLDRFYIVGNYGVFIEFILISGQWTVNDRKPLKKVNINDEFFIKDNLNDIIKTNFTTWSLSYNYTTTSIISTNKEGILILGDNNTIFIYVINNFLPGEEYIFLSFDNNINNSNLGNLKTGFKRNNDIYIYSKDKKSAYLFDINNFNLVEKDTNILMASSVLSISNSLLDGDYNKFYNYNNIESILVGDNSTLRGSILSTINDLDSTFGNNFSSKMLFMDYDIASKLNFFDNNSEYRLPSDFFYSATPSMGISSLSINSLSNELGWMDYMKDENKTFIYNTALTTVNQVLISTTFSSYVGGASESNTIIISDGTYITNKLSDISNLAPSFTSSPTASIVGPSASFSLYLYEKLMILKTDTMITPVSIGDVFNMSSDIISDNFIVNRVEDFGMDRYIYFYSNFNNHIINELDIITASVSFTNLNRFEDGDVNTLVTQFNQHPIGYGYEIVYSENINSATSSIIDSLEIEAKFNEKTAYYNLQSEIVLVTNGVPITQTINYNSSFLDFGYSPMYNLLDYLSNIDSSVFIGNKVFSTMPVYLNLPGSNSGVSVTSNKIVFNSTFKFEYDTFWENTFIDTIVYGSTTEITEKLLIIKKHYDSVNNVYIIETNKEINEPINPTTMDIKSRRTLSEISSDLRELNNIHRGEKQISYNSNLFYNLQNEIKYKFSTENYTKIFLSDSDIKRNLTSIVYIDNENKLSMNLINFNEEVNLNIINIIFNLGFVEIWTDGSHKLSVGDYVFVDDVDKKYTGIHIVKSVVNNNRFVSETAWIGPATNGGNIQHFIFDEYLNYEPVDIIDVGIDKKGKIAVRVNPDNIIENNDETVSLVNIDLNNYKFKLTDNLSIIDIANNYKWVLEAEIEDALIGQNKNGTLQWYKGILHCGRIFGMDFYSGIIRDVQWQDGTIHSVNVKINGNIATPNHETSNSKSVLFYGGTIHNGIWKNGTIFNGEIRDVLWENGLFKNGTIHNIVWNNGEFSGGVWIRGTWNSGIFNSNTFKSIWVDGTFNSGDFENGTWLNGVFNSKNRKLSRFGTKSTNSVKSIWESGKFISSELHSYLNTDNNNLPIASISNKYTVWKTGSFINSSFYGGTVYQVDLNNSKWYNGLLREIFIVGVLHDNVSPQPQPTGTRILLNGIWYFNRNDSFWVIDNLSGIESALGNNTLPMNYLVKDVNVIESDSPNKPDLTEIFIYIDLSSSVSSFGYTYSSTGWIPNPLSIDDSNHSLVSYFKNAEWESGIWENGIFDGSYINSVLWENGVFNSGKWT